jgi:hypothetical protein
MEPETQRIPKGDAAGVFVPPPHVIEQIRKQPECRLLWAVLQDGIETYRKYTGATSRCGQRLFADAERWIMRMTRLGCVVL